MADSSISRVAAVAATREGADAAKAGKSVSDCPYPDADDLTQEFLAHHWMKGYRLAAAG